MRVLLFLLLLAAVGCTSESGSTSANGTTQVVEVATAEALVDDLVTLDAEVVVLNFWATWCGPCRIEFPEFVRFDREMEGENVHVRFVSLDQANQASAVEAFLAEHDVADPSYFYTGTGDVIAQLNPLAGAALPVTMILDGEGIVQETHVGMMSYDELVASVEAARTTATSS